MASVWAALPSHIPSSRGQRGEQGSRCHRKRRPPGSGQGGLGLNRPEHSPQSLGRFRWRKSFVDSQRPLLTACLTESRVPMGRGGPLPSLASPIQSKAPHVQPLNQVNGPPFSAPEPGHHPAQVTWRRAPQLSWRCPDPCPPQRAE